MKVFRNQFLHQNLSLALVMLLALILSFPVAAQSRRPRRTNPQPKPDSVPRVITSTPVPVTRQADPPQKPEVKKPEKQEEAADEGGSLRIMSNLVAVPVSVTDGMGNPIRNLNPSDFQVEEEGQAQKIEFLGEPGKSPVDIAVLFDVSGSVHDKFQFEQQAVSRFLKTVFRQNDSATIFAIGRYPKVSLERTSNLEKAMAGAMALAPTKEGTALFDTVVKATHYLRETASPGTRRVIIVISDGEDNSSEGYNLPQALRELQQTDCLFYSINPSGPSIRLNKISQRGQSDMASMAQITGGYAFLPDKLEDLESVFQQIATELQAQYLLGYYPADDRTDGKFRRIAVKVPQRPELRIRARQGYYAPKA